MESEKIFLAKPEKPPALFHASRNPNIERFEPRAEKTRDQDEGPKIFATPSRAMASIFLADTDDSWVESGTVDDALYVVISDEVRFRKLDNGGAIYSLPLTTFETNPEKGLRELEWTSAETVIPRGKEIVPSALDDMLKHGVQVYFVDKTIFDQIQNAPDHGESIVKSLTPLR